MRYLSLFSGIEAASVAWADLGWHPVAFCEIDSFPSAVLSYRFPDVPNLGDITKVDWERFNEEYGSVDLIVGGSPCQSFSVAGRRDGLDGESGLMFEYLRAVRDVRPRWVLWENVPGVFSIDNGRAFGTLITSLQDLWYGVAWRVLDSQFVRVAVRDSDGRITGWVGPVAQRRRRVFLVGCFGEVGSAAAVLFERDSLRGNTKTSREKREELAAEAGKSTDSAICLQTDHLGKNGANATEGLCKTLDTQGQPAVYSRTERPKEEGGASVFKDTGLANTLNTFDLGDKRANELVVEEPICMAPSFSKRPGQQIATTEGGASYALTTGEPPRVLI